ncbi:protein-disulfide reductase DsbD family protein [Zunongwangia sp. F117]|uniref:Protein-disulfide reductase DsbD family protein n=1 Tax=Autumnicola musiva TaxID=3075589 RepID=A0ABU3D8U4_9FLAO|nr:protein-disulfide reductase DsbD domain-containing protein [Zunongwangia sp. F117]MDT0677955.1 protein-disulfide reductase DsbD family protein [Zunongwangia sp. F117]
MYKLCLTILLLFQANEVLSQIYDPVSWETSVEKISGNDYELIIKATIEPGWHLYAQNIDEGGPVPTSFKFSPNGKFNLQGETAQSNPHTVYDDIFEMETSFYEDRAEFRQKISLEEPGVAVIEGEVTFMVCDDTQCLPPETKILTFKLASTGKAQLTGEKNAADKGNDLKENENTEIEDKTVQDINSSNERSFWGIFFIAFLSGFAALLTPCVFPMIPMTVSFFTKQSKTKSAGIRNAVFYGVCIIIIYVILGSLVTLIFGADALNALSTNVWFNLIFFLLLLIFAFSFLGAFELVLPSSWSTRIDSKADRGGVIGIFFMALALAVVSFSCTGPIVGTLLVQAASEGGFAPLVGMLGFSSAIAIPFTLFAAFPGWLNSLPRSGGWLNTVKAVLGFLELALAFKFLSNADLVLQLHLLERETFLAIWIAIFGTLTLYLFGKINLPHDSPLPHISVGRLSLGIFVLAFTLYLIPGLWGAPLQWVSGFPPPGQYSESPYGVGNSRGGLTSGSPDLPEGAELGPHDIPSFHDYETGMVYATKEDKPVLLDFTGYACVNCRKMEERVWSDPKVLQVLKNDLVLISLYVDDKKALPEEEQYVSKTTGKKIETVGNKWSDFQIKNYKANAQPYYVLLDNKGKNLNAPTAYDPDIDSYLNWLNEGIKNYHEK